MGAVAQGGGFMPLKKVRTVLAVFCGLGLLAVAFPLAFFALWARIDTAEDRAFFWAFDPLLGLLVAVAVLLSGGRGSTRIRIARAAAVGVCVAGSMLLWHEFTVSVRWTASSRLIALNRVRMAQVALREYARDCGGFPTAAQGLAALHNDPGVPGWAGPYLEAEVLLDPWGNALQYRAVGGRAEVWSNGPDGEGGTADDVRPGDPERNLNEQ